jgi:hypothetical protein
VKLQHITTKYVYDVAGAEALRDPMRNKFSPGHAIISHRSGEGFREVRVHGFKLGRDGWSTSTRWAITDGEIVPNDVGGAPEWLKELLVQAVAQHDLAQSRPIVAVDHRVIMAFIQAPDEPDGDIGGPLRAAFRAAGLTVADGGGPR